MLNGTLELWDIRDVEAFCADIAHRQRPKLEAAYAEAGRHYGHHARQDFLAYLVAQTWELSLAYQPGNLTFSTWAGHALRHHATTTFIRNELKRTRWTFHNRTYERPRPTFVSTDTELGSALADRTMDGPEHRDPDLVRLLRTGPSTPPPGHPHHRRRVA